MDLDLTANSMKALKDHGHMDAELGVMVPGPLPSGIGVEVKEEVVGKKALTLSLQKLKTA